MLTVACHLDSGQPLRFLQPLLIWLRGPLAAMEYVSCFTIWMTFFFFRGGARHTGSTPSGDTSDQSLLSRRYPSSYTQNRWSLILGDFPGHSDRHQFVPVGIIPIDKLTRLQALATTWCSRRLCNHKEWESLVGHLAHAGTVIRPGRIFLGHLFALLSVTSKPHHCVRLNASKCVDRNGGFVFCEYGMVRPFLLPPAPAFHIYSDASGAFSCGTFHPSCGWFHWQWPQH